MLIEDVQTILRREPFVPLRVKKIDGKSLVIRFKHAAVVMKQHLLVFKGVKNERSRVAKSYEAIGYCNIARIEPRHPKSGRMQGEAQ